jgi:ABC-type antimicrobial peptide transport system permease subunit
MRTVARALRAVIRSPLRTGLLVAVLAVSVGLTLIMITVNEAFSERLDEVKGEVGSSVTVRPAGSYGGGFFRVYQQDPSAEQDDAAPTTLADEDIDQVWSIESVVDISRTITARYTGEELASASIQPPDQAPEGGQAPQGQVPEGFGTFQRPIQVTGTDDPYSLTTTGVTDTQLLAGRTFNEDEAEAAVAVVGELLAEANALDAGDTFEMEGTTIEVVGVFTTGTRFGDNSVFLPLELAQELFAREGEVDTVVVQADSVENAERVAEDIRALLGEDVVDVSTELSAFEAVNAPLSDAENSSRIGMIAALAASAAVILFSVGLVARQRVKEIGILKSIGASNWHITAQFGIETAALSVVAALVGAVATFPLAQSVADGLVSDPAAATGPGGFVGRGAAGVDGRAVQQAGGFLGDVDVAVSPEVFLYALVIAVGLAVIASVVPAWYAGRVKPAEVLRYE